MANDLSGWSLVVVFFAHFEGMDKRKVWHWIVIASFWHLKLVIGAANSALKYKSVPLFDEFGFTNRHR